MSLEASERCERTRDWPNTEGYEILQEVGVISLAPPPLQPNQSVGQWHMGKRCVAHDNTINLTEAIFEFPPQT